MFQKSKYLLIGLVTGLIVATATFAMAANPIKLIVNGQEIQCDVPPQNINGRVLVPARFVAESLGASVTWDSTNNAVVITSGTPLVVERKDVSSPTVEAGEQGVKEITFKGLKAIEVKGEVYFSKHEYENKYASKIEKDSNWLNFYESIFKDTENYIVFDGRTYIKSSLYRE
jgi:hypothetical protein